MRSQRLSGGVWGQRWQRSGVIPFQNKAHDVAPVGVLVRYRDAFIQGQAS